MRRLALAALVAVAPAAAWADSPVHVVATFSILGDMVKNVGGDRVEVTNIVEPGGDVHVYHPTPADAEALARADIIFANGLGFEGWLDRLVDASGTSAPLIKVAPNPGTGASAHDDHDDDHHGDEHAEHHDEAHEGEHHEAAVHDDDDHHGEEHAEHHDEAHEGEHHEAAAHDDDDHHGDEHAEHHDEAHEGEHHEAAAHDDDDDHHGEKHEGEAHAGHHHHHHGGIDPHAWQSIAMAIEYTEAIADGLSTIDPEGAAAYHENQHEYAEELDAVQDEFLARLAQIPSDRRTVITGHDAFGYFERDYGVKFLSPVGFSTEAEASAGDLARVIRYVRDNGIDGVFVEGYADPRLIQQVAREAGVRIGGTLYAGTLTGPDGPAPTYIEMMRHNMNQLLGVLEPAS